MNLLVGFRIKYQGDLPACAAHAMHVPLLAAEQIDGLALAVEGVHQAGLIDRHRSEADRRRTYLRLIPATLDRLLPAPLRYAPRVVFVCTHNSARSQLAAALWARTSGVPAACAGTRPAARVHPRTLAVARRHELTLDHPRTRHLDQVVRPGDLVVAVCDSAHEHLGPSGDRLHWSVPDPVPADTDDAFERAFTDIASRIDRLALAVHPPSLPRSDPCHRPTVARI
jgi:protein-tyrosine-phosphatase